jgi:hypothetical protein
VGASLVPEFSNRAQLVLDQGQDNKADICKLRKRGHIWIFFQKEKYWLTNQLKLN